MNEAKPLDLEEIRKKLDEKIFEVDQVIDWKIEPKGEWDEDVIEELIRRDVKIFSRVDYAIEWRDAEELLEEIKQRIKATCEFYLRYKDNPILFWKEQEKYRKQFKKKFGDVIIAGEEMRPFNDWKNQYNKWLFKLAFKDVFKEEENEE